MIRLIVDTQPTTDRGGGRKSASWKFFANGGKTAARSCNEYFLIIFARYVQVLITYLLRSGHQVSLHDPI